MGKVMKPIFGLPFQPVTSRGLSLVELMIALALSTTLILGVITVYLDSNQTSRLSTSLARIQESGRIAIDTIAL